tara:strand:- start:82 stop:1560 length:1479 start_codon:yes stop_codon:yes gene_type:complete
MSLITNGGSLNQVPGAIQGETLNTNYLDFAAGTADWAAQYLPEVMEKEAEVFGNRTISGFLSQVGAEEPMSSDQVVWSEQGRLHLAYTADITHLTAGTAAGGRITIIDHIDTNAAYVANTHGIRPGDTVLLATSAGTLKCYVEAAANGSNIVDVVPYTQANLGSAGVTMVTGSENARVFVYGSEFVKGAAGRTMSNIASHVTLSNKPIILKDYYEVSGSDTAQIGWVEVSGEDGQSGYFWYLKSAGETRSRFSDYLETAMLEGELDTSGATSGVDTALGVAGNSVGTEGLFAAVRDRGNSTGGITGTSAAQDLAEFDAILAEFDSQGAIEEYMMFVDRTTSLAIDDMLGSMNSYGAGGTSYGVFNNSADMALNLGFTGFRRGSYDFYKSDFKYLNQKDGRGAINAIATGDAIRGVMIPAGVSSVYDQAMGRNIKRPFLHVRYRASQADNRKYKSWVVGSVGAMTSGDDTMQMHFLSERCLVTQGANNFMLLS